MKKIDIYALDRGLDYRTVTSGRNGYPSDLRKAVVFDTQDETEDFANEIGGEVVLLHRRDGWSLWESLGRYALPYRFELFDRAYNDDEEACAFALRYECEYEQALDEMNATIADAAEDEGACELYEPDRRVLDLLATYDGAAQVIVLFRDGEQVIDYVFEDSATRWHDSDVHEYQLAVMCDDEWADEFWSLHDFCDYLNACSDLPSRYDAILDANGWTDGGDDYICHSDDEMIDYDDASKQYECRPHHAENYR